MPIMRLDKFFSSQGLASRREVKKYMDAKAIYVNGEPAHKLDQKIDPQRDEVLLQGKRVQYKEHLYLMLNKPQGVVSATNDREHRTVLDLVPPEFYREGLFPAGRLDKDTTGFVLLTDDGDFAHRMLAPKNHISKVYQARINVHFSREQIEHFAEGVVLKDGFVCLPAKLRILEDGPNPLVEITLHEGKYHQIKRMVAACGGKVLTLHRVQLGGLMLDDRLAPGEMREILHKELSQILAT